MTAAGSRLLRVAVVMTVFNRREVTLRCLRTIRSQGNRSVQFTVYVVDDASTDGTGKAIEAEFPEVRLIQGNGSLYWNGGMRLALEHAYRQQYDFYWWLNDDVVLDNDAFHRLLKTFGTRETPGERAIVVGSLRDPDGEKVTYGGVSRLRRFRKTSFSLIEPSDAAVSVETMNGNCVLVASSIALALGNLTPEYRQKMGDFDYGLRAREAGFDVIVAPGTYGTCGRHDDDLSEATHTGAKLSDLWSTKELPFGPWATFCRRWGGPLWLFYFVSPYARRAAGMLGGRLQRTRRVGSKKPGHAERSENSN